MQEAKPYFINPEQSTLPKRKVYFGRDRLRRIYPDGLFPRLATREDIKSELQADKDYDLYTGNLLAEAYSFDDLVQLDPNKVNLAELLFKQHQTRYPSPAIRKINVRTLMEKMLAERAEEYNLRKFKRSYRDAINYAVSKVFTVQELEPDFSVPETTGQVDPSINLFLALHLALGSKFSDTTRPIKTIEELALFAREHNQDFDSRVLREGFIDLVSENTIANLINQGVLKADDLGNFFESVANLMTENSLHLAKQSIYSSHFLFPYHTGLFSEATLGNPDYAENTAIAVDFLPHLFGAYLNYLVKFHEVIKEGESFDPMRLQTEIQRLFKFSGEALSYYMRQLLGISKHVPQPDLKELFAKTQQKEPNLAENVALIYTSLQQMKPYFEQILAYYKKHPELLNKLLPDANSEAHVTSYKTWQEEILKLGGKPSSHARIQFRHNVRKGQV